MTVYQPSAPTHSEIESMKDYWVQGDVVLQSGWIHSPVTSSGEWITFDVGATFDFNVNYEPSIVVLRMLRESNQQLARPVVLECSSVDGEQYVSDDALGCWGSGATVDEAITDFERNLLEEFDDLESAELPLSKLAADRLEQLRSYLHG